jgi:uncharacterized protein (TIGR02145 family)
MSTVTGGPRPFIMIGTQAWSTKNLSVDTYRNGDIIPQVTDNTEWTNLTTGAWCWYNNDSANGAVYGKLYNWWAVNDTRGLAPNGYHIPSSTEWDTLQTYLGGNTTAGGKLKETGTTHWNNPNTGATNSSGFTALSGGFRYEYGVFLNINTNGYWWTTTLNPTYPYYYRLLYNTSTLFNNIFYKNAGFSVRLIKD